MSLERPPRHEDTIKYAPGVGARVPSNQRPLRAIEWAVLVHLGIFVVGITWGFGGAADWLRLHYGWWGGIGVLLLLTAIQDREARAEGWLRPLVWLWPFVAFNVFVLLGCLNPSFGRVKFGTEFLLVNKEGWRWLPSSAQPDIGLGALGLFDVIWISCFNLALVVRQRRALRGLLLVITANAFALAVFGTVQKFSQSTGLFFNSVKSPQKFFFASFVYHNHWGAFAVLMLAAGLGLAWHYARRADGRSFFHSPAFTGVVAVFFIAASVPLSTSRSTSILAAVLIGAAILHWFYRLMQSRRRRRESVTLPLFGALAAVALAAGGVWFVARDSILMRTAKTREQLDQMRERGTIGSRIPLYKDTWRMAQAKPWFGWGMGSYPHVFSLYNSQKSVDKLPVFYRDAHSDWLQAFAEHGFVGSALLALCALLPLLGLKARHISSPVPCYLLAGCALILLYAWVEFPFGNLAVILCWWLLFFLSVSYARLYDREAPSPAKSARSTAGA